MVAEGMVLHWIVPIIPFPTEQSKDDKSSWNRVAMPGFCTFEAAGPEQVA